jgi:integrase
LKTRFTATKVAAFRCPPDKQQSFLWDSDTSGLGLKANSGGSRKYILESRLSSGETIRLTIGDPRSWSISAAQEEARRLQTLIDQGNDPRKILAEQLAAARAEQEAATAEEARRVLTVGAAWQIYLDHHERRWGVRHMADHRNLSQRGGEKKKRGKGLTKSGVIAPLLEMRMVGINAATLTEWQSSEAETRANNARQGFELFRAFWRWCASRAEYAEIIDAAAVEDRDLRAEVPSRKNKRFDVLERAQLPAWFAAVRGLSNPVVSAYLQGLLLTGARREELGELRWKDVDFQWGSLWVKDKVAAEGRKIPLTPYLNNLLASLPRRKDSNGKAIPWVFSSPTSANGRLTEPRIPHNRALSVAGLPHVTLHGLRRTFASLAEWVEMPRGIVAQIMGHAPNATAERHYINRPLELLAVWHGNYEAWILEQAGIYFEPNRMTGVSKLRAIE